jgi:hypothetical protein
MGTPRAPPPPNHPNGKIPPIPIGLHLWATLLPPRPHATSTGGTNGVYYKTERRARAERALRYPHFESKKKAKTGESAFGSVGVVPRQAQAGRCGRPLAMGVVAACGIFWSDRPNPAIMLHNVNVKCQGGNFGRFTRKCRVGFRFRHLRPNTVNTGYNTVF